MCSSGSSADKEPLSMGVSSSARSQELSGCGNECKTEPRGRLRQRSWWSDAQEEGKLDPSIIYLHMVRPQCKVYFKTMSCASVVLDSYKDMVTEGSSSHGVTLKNKQHIHLMIFTTSDIHWACTKHFTQWKSRPVYTFVELLWTYTLTVKGNKGDDDNGLVIMMTMIRVHPRRQRLLTTDFNVQWEILPPIAHLGYELREIKVLLLEGNNIHISWNTFLCYLIVGSSNKAGIFAAYHYDEW